MQTCLRLIVMSLVVMMLSSCQWWKAARIQSQDIPLEFVDFQDSLAHAMAQDPKSVVERWQQTQSPFFVNFCEGVIGIKMPEGVLSLPYFQEFLSAPSVKNAQNNIGRVYSPAVMKQIKEATLDGFKHFRYYFPNAPLPKIYFYNSGYNASVMLGDGFVGVSLEKFLGDTAHVYRALGIPDYFYSGMTPEHVPIELLGAWFQTLCPEPANSTLLDRIIWEGKKLYFLTQCFPRLKESLLLSYTPEQWSLLEEQEMALWAKLVEDHLLFQKQNFLIAQLCEPAPFSALIAQSTPGRAANWIGLRIVKKYMEKQRSSLPELLQFTDSQALLQISQYKP